MVSCHSVLPFSLSKATASALVVGTLIPYLMLDLLTLALTDDKITSRLRSIYGTHQQKAGSASI